MNDLFQRSVNIILQNQTQSGAYLASPNFPTYHYCWFRDGSFIAYAMDLVGEHESARRFHQWAATAVSARAEVVERAIAKASRREPLTGTDYLHTRYAPDGTEVAGVEWPNFQLDGFGTWLWALGEHARLTRGAHSLPPQWLRAAGHLADYLTALWALPCYDCWEEFPNRVHPHTLAAIFGGLAAHSGLTGADHGPTLSAIQEFVRRRGAAKGGFAKFIGSQEVDASLLGLAVPYGVVAPDDPLMLTTVHRIEQELRRGGGVHRYAADTYYGGGEWVLLTAWLGWYYAQAGEWDKAQNTLRWVEAQADSQGRLTEQVPATLNAPAHYTAWRERWGEVANPLLWSHAKYLVLVTALKTGRDLAVPSQPRIAS